MKAIITIKYLSSADYNIDVLTYITDNPRKMLLDLISNDSGVYGMARPLSINNIDIIYNPIDWEKNQEIYKQIKKEK